MPGWRRFAGLRRLSLSLSFPRLAFRRLSFAGLTLTFSLTLARFSLSRFRLSLAGLTLSFSLTLARLSLSRFGLAFTGLLPFARRGFSRLLTLTTLLAKGSQCLGLFAKGLLGGSQGFPKATLL